MAGLNLQLLGPPVVSIDGVPQAFPTRKSLALLIYLFVARQRQGRDFLATLLWPHNEKASAFSLLRPALYALRKMDTGGWISADRASISANLDSDFTVDVDQFRSLIAVCEAKDAVDDAQLIEATELYRGDFLAGFGIDSYEFEEWQRTQEVQLKSEMMSASRRLTKALRDSGNTDAAIRVSHKLLALDRYDEEAHRDLMQLYAESGRKTLAIQQYESCVKTLNEIETEPGSATEQLFSDIRANRFSELVKTKSFIPEKGDHNLPRRLTSFIGREDEVNDLLNLMRNNILLTLIGAGGCGKTSLGIRIAKELASEYKSGVCYVDLTKYANEEGVVQAMISALDLQEHSEQDLPERLYQYLENKHLLIVLDNCEHLIEATVRLAQNLLSRCTRLAILATSREPLKVGGETIYRVPPLSFPDKDRLATDQYDLKSFESVLLFLARAGSAFATFVPTEKEISAIGEICRHLDGMPLAIELAAARVKSLSVGLILKRLVDRLTLLSDGDRSAPPRHQTLRGAIDWSFDYLSEAEKTLLQRLSVFRGGCTLEAVESICAGQHDKGNGGIRSTDALNLLLRLVDKSLVNVEGNRYKLLETIQAYAREKFEDLHELAEVDLRHRDWYLSFAEEAADKLKGREQMLWLGQLKEEMPNIRKAFEWSMQSGEEDKALQLTGSLWWYWTAFGNGDEGRNMTHLALERCDKPTLDRAKGLLAAGSIAFSQSDFGQAERFGTKSLEIFRNLRHKIGEVWCHFLLSGATLHTVDEDEAFAHVNKGFRIAKKQKDPWIQCNAFRMAGIISQKAGDLPRAESLQEKALILSKEIEDRVNQVWILYDYGSTKLVQHQLLEAEKLFRQSLELSQSLGLGVYEGRSYHFLGKVFFQNKEFRESISCHQKSLKLGHQNRRDLHSMYDLQCLAQSAIHLKSWQYATKIYGYIEANQSGLTQHYDRIHFDEIVADLDASVNMTSFKSAWEEGAKISLDEIVEYALTSSDILVPGERFSSFSD